MQNIPRSTAPKITLRPSAKILLRKMIYFYGPILRSDLAECLDVTSTTVTTNINVMLTAGSLCELEDANSPEGKIGRKASLIDINAASHYFIGVEIRQSARHICLTDYRGRVLFKHSDIELIRDYDENIRRVCSMICKLLSGSPVPRERISGIGIAIPGVVDWENGVLLAHHQYRWFNRNVREDIQRGCSFDGIIAIGNDANARALGIQLYQREQFNGTSTLAYLFVARGISCPFILRDTNLHSRALGLGELGYMLLTPPNFGDSLGLGGTLSSFSGERSLADKCLALIAENKSPFLREICEGKRPTIQQILQAQQQGESSVCELIRQSLEYLGYAICNVCNFILPDAFIIDARVADSAENRAYLMSVIREHLMLQDRTHTQFHFVETNDFNGARSAAALAIRAQLNLIED